ncbi:MAG: plasmid pRiA4b ORF-3 family protein [Tannerellaceae bacterium]|jgi:hypothetical protein|nr:plasmid pRiA4b ORF-3 family protein [Tannerellaceae bacterium]
MIYRFLILSDETDDFVREIEINTEASFLELHDAIVRSVGYDEEQMASFFICDEDWNKKIEITLVDMNSPSEEDIYLMEDTRLEELMEDEGQKLLYVFDYMTERAFFIELREIVPGKTLQQPVCRRSEGMPPPQSINFEEIEAKIHPVPSLGESFYGDLDDLLEYGYDINELDADGLDGLDPSNDPFDEERY